MAITQAKMETATNTSTYDGILPLFETGDIVFRRSDYDKANQQTFIRRDIDILEVFFKTDENGAPLDANGNIADGSVSASVATDNSNSDTAPEYPFFYRCKYQDTRVEIELHESELLTLTGANSVRDANDWT